MSIPATLKKEIEEATKLLDTGRESHTSLSKRFNVEVEEIYAIHHKRLAREDLKYLKEEIGKRRKERDALSVEIAKRREELQRLDREKENIKSIFQRQRLSWADGVRLVSGISDLRKKKAGLDKELTSVRWELTRLRAGAKDSRSTLLQLKVRLADLRGTMKREEGWFHNLLGQISSAQDGLYVIKEEERQSAERAKIMIDQLGKRKASLQAEIQSLTEETTRLKASVEFLTGKVNWLTAERENLQSEKEEQIKKAKEVGERIVADAEMEAKKILAGAEQERNRILAATEDEKEKILAEGNVELKELSSKLKGEIKGLKRERQQLKIDVKREERKKAKIKEGSEKLVEMASDRAKMIVEGAEVERKKILKRMEALKNLKGRLEAEIELVRMALRDDVQKLRKKPREIPIRLSPEQFSALKKMAPNGDVEALIRETIRDVCTHRQKLG